MGKAIYRPAGKAGEYAEYACNFYNGCSNGCEYCYCKKGVLAKQLGGDTPTLKKCFQNEDHALAVFTKELYENLQELQQHGLFFSFTTDPMLPETKWLTWSAIATAAREGVRSKILTKRADFADAMLMLNPADRIQEYTKYMAIGFTLTGHDEMEPNASTNAERIEAMKKLHEAGFKTFASIEPIIDIQSAFSMIFDTAGFCNLYKIGLMSGKKYDGDDLLWLMERCHGFTNIYKEYNFPVKFYFKDSFLAQAGIDRADLPANCVGRDYNIFNH